MRAASVGVMSIDRILDDFYERRGIVPQADVVPDHACQVFAPAPVTDVPDSDVSGDGHRTADPEGELDAARGVVEKLLRS